MWERMQGFSWTVERKEVFQLVKQQGWKDVATVTCKQHTMTYWTHLFIGGRRLKAVILQQVSAGRFCSWRRWRGWTRRLRGENAERKEKAEYNLQGELLKSGPSTGLKAAYVNKWIPNECVYTMAGYSQPWNVALQTVACCCYFSLLMKPNWVTISSCNMQLYVQAAHNMRSRSLKGTGASTHGTAGIIVDMRVIQNM